MFHVEPYLQAVLHDCQPRLPAGFDEGHRMTAMPNSSKDPNGGRTLGRTLAACLSLVVDIVVYLPLVIGVGLAVLVAVAIVVWAYRTVFG
jgi:hypothetical protein